MSLSSSDSMWSFVFPQNAYKVVEYVCQVIPHFSSNSGSSSGFTVTFETFHSNMRRALSPASSSCISTEERDQGVLLPVDGGLYEDTSFEVPIKV